MNRVIADAVDFEEPRPAGSVAERSASNRLARRLADAGWTVMLHPSRPAWLPTSRLGAFALAVILPWPALPLLLWYVIAIDQLVPDFPAWIRWGVPILMVTALADALWTRVRQCLVVDETTSPVHVVATAGPTAERSSRLIFLTRTRTPPKSWVPVLEFLLLIAGTYPVLRYRVRIASDEAPGFWALVALLVVPWLILLLLAHGLPVPPRSPRVGDNRTGLALLTELARIWPKQEANRPETWFVASPDTTDLGRILGPALLDGCPTLLVALDAPGVGAEIVIAGRGRAATLAADVAQALWLPHRVRRTAIFGKGHQGWIVPEVPAVSLCGVWNADALNPAILVGVTHLVQEMALRWNKLAANQGDEGAIAARSSQNPG